MKWVHRGLAPFIGFLLLWVHAAPAQTLTLTSARATLSTSDATVQQTVALPYHWDAAHPGVAGHVVFDFSFTLPEAPTDLWGLYLPRLGNRFEIWLNGVQIKAHGFAHAGDAAQGDGGDYARIPRYVTLGAGHLRTANHLRIHIQTDAGRRGGLAPVVLGPEKAVRPLYDQAYRWRVTGSVAVVAFSLAVGLTALALWWTHVQAAPVTTRRRDPLYLHVGLAQLLWALYVGDVLVEHTPLPWPAWGIVQVLALEVWGGCMTLAGMELARWRERSWVRRLRQGLLVCMALGPVAAALGLAGGWPQVLTLWYLLLGACMLVFIVGFLGWAARGQALEPRIVALAAFINILVALRDIYVFRIDPTLGANTMVRYSSVLFGLALGYVALTRFRATHAQLQELLHSLAQRINQKEAALAASYVQLEQLARQQERASERTRILRNMHDGVGAHISSAMRQLQGEPSTCTREEVLGTLRDAMDQLKLSIDALHFVAGDVTALLANLRYRLGPRFASMGIVLHWNLEPLPVCESLDACAMSELQFMLFEAFSNVLQHARAHTLCVEGRSAHRDGQPSIVVRVIDDGCGFDPEQCGGKGLAGMRARARHWRHPGH